jgi:hypothetical protein
MTSAVAEAGRVIRRGGVLLDVHPTDERSLLEVWTATGAGGVTDVTPDTLAAVTRTPLDRLDHDPAARLDFTRATDALADALADYDDEGTWELAGVHTFEYQYFFEDLDELTDYFDDNHEHAHASDALLEQAARVLGRATGLSKLVVIQRTLVSALRKC